uniref:F-box domain-containing protein n=1 Tax=Opuntia streptacantha TaxID=393608 RepID=A0A7C9EL38_OPUST
METRRRARKRMRLEHGRMLETEDRLSNLPQHLVEEIISRLPSRSIAWMSTLYKKWAYLLESFPGLFFDEEEFEYKSDRQNDVRLHQFVSKYMSRQTPILIQEIRIGTTPFRRTKFNHQVGLCMKLVDLSRIRVLDLKFRLNQLLTGCHCYAIPGAVFSQGAQLTILELEGCRLENIDAVNVPLLKTVSMTCVHISDETLFKLVAMSCNLESLELQHCYELRSFRIASSSLERLGVSNCRHMETFYLDCPHLWYLKCKGREVHEVGRDQEISYLWTSSCVLRDVEFTCVDLGAEMLDHIFSSSTHVKSLTMRSCKVEGGLKALPQDLKHLQLDNTYVPELLGLSTVESFSYGRHSQPSLVYPFNCLTLYGAIVRFVQLKSLTLQEDLPSSDKSLESILEFCDELHSLYLICCRNLRYPRIISSTLKILSVKSSKHVQLECEIEAPNLLSFEFEGRQIQFSRVVVSHELRAKLQFEEFFWSYDLMFSNRVQYVRMFNEARLLMLSNKFAKCELTPAQAAVPSWNCCGQMKVSASFQIMDCKRFLSELLCLPFYPTTLFLDIKLVGAPISDDSSTFFELKFYGHCQQGTMQQGEGHDCIRDHVYAVSVQIREGPFLALELSKFLLHKAMHLMKLKVHVSYQLPAEIRPALISRVTAMKQLCKDVKLSCARV